MDVRFPRTIVVAHGALGSAQQMQPVAEAFRQLGDGRFEVRVVEFPGHGDTPRADAEAFRLANFVDDLARVVSTCEAPPLLFGYSMGGYVGLALETRAPDTFAGIVTLGTRFQWDIEGAEREAARLDPVTISTKVPRFAAALEARHAHAGGWETVVVRTAALLRANAQAPLLSLDVLERVSIPVTVAVGDKDDTVSVAETQAAAAVMRFGRCVVLPDTPHPIERVKAEHLVGLLRPVIATLTT